MKNYFNKALLGCALVSVLGTSCKKYLDINTNPNGPEKVDAAIYLAPIQTNYAMGVQFDARGIAPYIQNWMHSQSNPWNIHGYNSGSDFGGELWRNVYWRGGQNTLDLISQAREDEKWDVLGVGLALQAWGWQMLTDYHGEIILREAFSPNQNKFPYTDQETVYNVVDSLSREAIAELSKSEGGIGSSTFTRFDIMYKGDRTKWLKFVYGLRAINQAHLSNKSSYNPDLVIKYVDSSFASSSDDALVPFNGTSTSDANFFGPLRNNLQNYGQSAYIVRLLDSTGFGVKDPRRTVMLSPSNDGKYRGLAPSAGITQSATTSATAAGIKNLWGTTMATNPPAGTVGRYLYQDKAPFPLMTYAMLQFIKAEAAFKKGDKDMALDAYKKGINAHMDFVKSGAKGTNSFVFADPTATANFDAEKTLYLASPNVIPAAAANLTLSQIMLQKYIALWGWGYIETWSDLRRYDYSNTVFTGFTLPDPSILPVTNNSKYAYRVRPRYNSEYIWNIDALTAIGGFDQDFHTKKMWFHQP